MVRSLLYLSGLSPIYWSDALLHAVYLKNRLWHSALDITPFEALNKRRPNISHLRVFGSRLTARIPGEPRAKLDDHCYDGIFLGHSFTPSNLHYIDICTGTCWAFAVITTIVVLLRYCFLVDYSIEVRRDLGSLNQSCDDDV